MGIAISGVGDRRGEAWRMNSDLGLSRWGRGPGADKANEQTDFW